MWPFNKKTEYIYIPEDHIDEFLRRYDAWWDTTSKLDRFKFWSFVENICPEVRGKNVRIDFSNATKPRLRILK